ncbi:hypothetical protein TKK_0018561 [Trichogramma kaykai]|uniref:Uncharacterized protein n=1 Tax=Trichogramma kaykai TaxID=54128 RepID=A0ABD2VZ20_9HYME
MLVPRLSPVFQNLCRINQSIARNVVSQQRRLKSTQEAEDEPIKWSQSEASKWKAEYSRAGGPPIERVWWSEYSVMISVAAFMIYFCYLREENDLDERIYAPLTETVVGIEKAFPDYNFHQKPDFIIYHEENKRKKLEAAKQAEQKR